VKAILLTGCSGYIGRTLVPQLKQRGVPVVGLDRKPYGRRNLDEFIEGDLRDDALLGQIPSEIDTVCHLAAAKDDWGLSDQEYFSDNVIATRKLLKTGTARGIRNWLFFSSVAVLGPSVQPLSESAPFSPEGAYGASKAAGEKLFWQLAEKEPAAKITIIRPSVVFGPDNPPNTNIYRLIHSIQNNRFVMIGKGDTIKTCSYIDNLIEATLFLLERMSEGVQTFIYVDEPKLSTANIIAQISMLLKKDPPKWHIPLGVAAPLAHVADIAATVTRTDLPITAARIKKFCRSTNYDGSALRNLGFRPSVAIEDALRRTVEWYLAAK
jgi:nucleoside-diphosphate-sugar epimerase